MQPAFPTDVDSMSRMKKLTKTAFCAAYLYSGAAHVQEWLQRRAGRQFMTILLFHRVTDQIPEDGITVSTARFRSVCRLLRQRFRVVPLAEVFDVLRSGRPMPPRTVAVTFDDCYRDNLFAARVLAEYGLAASFFVPTAFVGTDRTFPWDADLPRMANLSWDDVREMVRMGHEIGSHTVSHVNLGTASYNEARTELFESKAVLEKQLARKARWFAYPYGGINDLRPETAALVEEAGYEGCLSGYGGFVYPGADDRILPRDSSPCYQEMLNVELHLRGCLEWFYTMKRSLGLPDGLESCVRERLMSLQVENSVASHPH
jgi:peptidoglycan/xylan/chitin deacetylase (PgdA/CDA1 family)